MSSIILDDSVLDRLRERYPQYQETVYLFVLSALHHVIEQLPEPRHITGPELATGVRDLALARFGPMARTVLEHWGVRATEDVHQQPVRFPRELRGMEQRAKLERRNRIGHGVLALSLT